MPTAPTASGCGPSSPELKANVANFLRRADAIAASPLAGRESTFTINMQLDPTTGEVTPTDFRLNLIPEDEWLPMAVRMGPIIFNETDPVHINRLTAQVEREHVPLRGRLRQARSGYAAWKEHTFAYAPKVSQRGVPLPEGKTMEGLNISFGPPGMAPSVPADQLSSDYEYALTYLNGCVWHSDTEKVRAYEEASQDMQQHFQHCAEMRVLGAAKDIVAPLRQWLVDARADGHDL